MKEIVKTVHITQKDESELTDAERKLIDAAKSSTYRSYAPYSKFCVGAAIQLEDGEVLTGNNQENCAFPSGLCAERTALFYTNAQYPDTPVAAIAIAARDSNGEFTSVPISPCGSCRQALLETEHRFARPIRVMLYGTEGIYFIDSVRDLLPVGFDSDCLV
ncbi:MAG: cytidine deaminase [Bacteroidaceae bacterium]|nr:cytidine deaminase [Bacteroidaceae bacterium]MBQ8676688.1 cytidine deaminase [Bacteroidaceae bacterium]MBQ9175780.1 cytidine deaminase [Bacteroidaceae bacterium]MBR1379259.1 cytidine deaminase [Bacteroidaceae bacterium]